MQENNTIVGMRQMILSEENRMRLDIHSSVLKRVNDEVELVTSCYVIPSKKGVTELHLPKVIRNLMSDRLLTLTKMVYSSDFDPTNEKQAQKLVSDLRNMGPHLGFSDMGLTDVVDAAFCADPLFPSTLDGNAFFVWEPESEMMERILTMPPTQDIGFVNRQVELKGMISKGRTPEEGREFYSLVMYIHPQYAPYPGRGASLVVRLSTKNIAQFDINPKGKVTAQVSDGDIVDNLRNTLDYLERMGVTPQHILYALQRSNLGDAQRNAVAALVPELQKYPHTAGDELFVVKPTR